LLLEAFAACGKGRRAEKGRTRGGTGCVSFSFLVVRRETAGQRRFYGSGPWAETDQQSISEVLEKVNFTSL
jgi:hypothetical protein